MTTVSSCRSRLKLVTRFFCFFLLSVTIQYNSRRRSHSYVLSIKTLINSSKCITAVLKTINDQQCSIEQFLMVSNPYFFYFFVYSHMIHHIRVVSYHFYYLLTHLFLLIFVYSYIRVVSQKRDPVILRSPTSRRSIREIFDLTRRIFLNETDHTEIIQTKNSQFARDACGNKY